MRKSRFKRPIFATSVLVVIAILLGTLGTNDITHGTATGMSGRGGSLSSGDITSVFKEICSKKLGEGHKFCKSEDLSLDIEKPFGSDDLPHYAGFTGATSILLEPYNKMLCSVSWSANEITPNIWNNIANKCQRSPAKSNPAVKASCDAAALYDNESHFVYDHKQIMLTVIALHNKCDKLSEAEDKTNCTNKATKYSKCIELVDAWSEVNFKPEDHIEQPNIEDNTSLLAQDFEDMNLYARYIRTLLDSCRRKNGTHCKKIQTTDNLGIVDVVTGQDQKISATFQLNDIRRLATLVKLTAYGSEGVSLKGGDKKLSDLPNLIPNTSAVNLSNGECLSVKAGYEQHNLNYYHLGGTGLEWKILEITCSDNTGGPNYILLEVNYKCNLFSKLNYAMDLAIDSDKVCTYNDSALIGANRIINFCKNNDKRCAIFIDGSSLLSNQKARPIFLQTMYWNFRDIKDHGTGSGYPNIEWKRLESEEKAFMTWVINNPDTSSIKGSKEGETTTVVGETLTPCDIEGGMGWMLCGAADFLMNSYDAAYEELEDWMVIKSRVFGEIDGVNPTKNIWTTMISIANILVVIVLLIIIVSYVTGYGISNYQIKTILPKVIVSVILINISYFGIELLAGLSNIVGGSIYSMLVKSAEVEFVSPTTANLYSKMFVDSGPINVLNLIVFIVGTVLWLVTMIAQLLILAARDAILILATAMAPVVAVLYFLPNTKKITSLWSKGLIFSLILYPTTALVFAIGRISYELSATTDDFISGVVSRTMLILPMAFSPYLVFKLGKSMPVISAGLASFSKKARGLISGTDKPKEGSRRWYKQQQLREVDKQVRAGQYTGGRPIRRIKSAVFRGLNKTAPFAENAINLQNQVAKTHSERSELINGQDARSIIGHFEKHRGDLPIQTPKPKAGDSTNIKNLLDTGSNNKDLLLEAALAHIKDTQETGTTDVRTFMQALNLAREHGAGQEELQATYKQALSYYKGDNNFAATGMLKGVTAYYTENPDNNGNVWGNYDDNLYDHPTDKDGNETDFTTSIKKATRSEMVHQVLEQPVNEDGTKNTVESSYMPEDSIARQVFNDEFANNREFEIEIRQQATSFSSETYSSIDKSLNNGLSYDIFSGSLTQEMVDEINSGTLTSATEATLSQVLVNSGVLNYSPQDIALMQKYDIATLQDKVKNIKILDSTEKANLVGWSFKNAQINPLTVDQLDSRK